MSELGLAAFEHIKVVATKLVRQWPKVPHEKALTTVVDGFKQMHAQKMVNTQNDFDEAYSNFMKVHKIKWEGDVTQ